MYTRSGVRTHEDYSPLDLKSNALTTRPSWSFVCYVVSILKEEHGLLGEERLYPPDFVEHHCAGVGSHRGFGSGGQLIIQGRPQVHRRPSCRNVGCEEQLVI